MIENDFYEVYPRSQKGRISCQRCILADGHLDRDKSAVGQKKSNDTHSANGANNDIIMTLTIIPLIGKKTTHRLEVLCS